MTTSRSHPRFFQRCQRGSENSYLPKEAQGILIFPKIPQRPPERLEQFDLLPKTYKAT